MAVVAVVGAQWGDEGKGKIVDHLAQKADVVVRFNGGANAGHSVEVGGKKFKFHQMPCGALYKGKQVVMGNGMVLDPKLVLEEIEVVKKETGAEPNLIISGRAHVVLPYHFALDAIEEETKGKLAAGTTKRGIGPCYSDKAARFGIRIADLLDKESLKEKIHTIHAVKTKTIEQVYGGKFTEGEDEIYKACSDYGVKLAKYVGDCSSAVNAAISAKKNVLLEGAQGTMLDIDHGAYPFGTSSSTTAGGASTGAGIGPGKIGEVIGVIKAYTSRVGAGPLPTEITGEIAQKIRDKGGEYGTTTGRPRRIGWLDLPALKYACDVNGFTGLAFTRIDTLAGTTPLKLCVAYELDGKKTTAMPQTVEELARCKPIYEEMPGWKDLPQDEWRKICVKGYFSFPDAPKNYVRKVSEFLGVEPCIVSVGAGREDTIVIKDVFGK